MRNRRKAVRLMSAAMLACALALAAAPLAFAEPDDQTYTEEPSYGEPTYDEPTYDEPTYDEPTTDEPTYDEPAYDEPTTDEPTYDEPTYDEPTTDEPTYDEPTYDEPTTDEPTYDDPTYYEPDYPEYYTPETTFEDNWSYDDYGWDESYTLDQNNATSELSTDVSVDTSELTKSDWDEMKRAFDQKTSSSGNSANLDARAFSEVKKNRDDGTSHNDVWIFLVTGIPLIVVGAGLIAAVIIIQVRSSRMLKADETIAMHTAAGPAKAQTASAHQSGTAPKKAKDKDLGDTLTEPLDIKGKNGRNK